MLMVESFLSFSARLVHFSKSLWNHYPPPADDTHTYSLIISSVCVLFNNWTLQFVLQHMHFILHDPHLNNLGFILVLCLDIFVRFEFFQSTVVKS